MALTSLWGTATASLLAPLGYISSAWGTATVTVIDPYTVGAIPTVFDQTTQTWITVQPMVWDEALQQWKPQ